MLAVILLVDCMHHAAARGFPAPFDTEAESAARFPNPEGITVVGSARRPDPIVRARPKYPSNLEGDLVSGAAIAAYVIDTTGHVELGTASFLAVTRREFGTAVCDYLPKLRYAPFVGEGKKLRILIVQAHEFVAPGGPEPQEITDALGVQSRSEEEYAKLPVVEVIDRLRKLPHC